MWPSIRYLIIFVENWGDRNQVLNCELVNLAEYVRSEMGLPILT